MRRLLLALLALAAIPAAADVYTWGTHTVGKGYRGPSTWDLYWFSTGQPRPAAAVTATLVVYSKAPTNGVGGTVLFTEPMLPAGDPNPTNEMVAYLTTTDTARPGTYYSEVIAVEGTTTDVLHGYVKIEGL